MELESIQSNVVKHYDTCVILHIYYPDMWNSILSYLSNLDKQFDLFVTIPYEVDISESTIKEHFPDAQIYQCENRGRDIAPFLLVFSAISELDYKYICKIHTKKSPHIINGIEWQQDMLRKLLGSPKTISQIKKAFDERPDWGLIAPQGHVTPYNYFWKLNAEKVLNLAESVGIPTNNIDFSFVAGSMFWFRPQALRLLSDTGISTQDFEAESGQQDGALAHAFERFLGMIARHDGYKIAECDSEEVRFFDISFQFRILLQVLQDQEKDSLFQITEREKTINALSTQVEALFAQVNILSVELADIKNSNYWKLMLLLKKIRISLFPYSSRREYWLKLGIHGAFYFRHYGLSSFIKRVIDKLKHRNTISITNYQIAPFTFVIQNGSLCFSPAISIVIEKNSATDLPLVTEEDVLSWASTQTLRDIEVVTWNSDKGNAITLGESSRTWDASNFEELCRGLAGRYLCMASPDLLQRNQMYLETNLIVIESESLVFTINVFGKSDWILPALMNNRLPGNRTLPYLRQVIRTDCARNGFSIDIANRFAEHAESPLIIGKIITHTTAFPDTTPLFPAETLLTDDAEYRFIKNYVFARSSSQIPWEPMTHIVHPVNTVIPARPESSNLPTIIMFLPFLAVGGAEYLALQLIHNLQEQARFIVVTVEGMDAALGTTADIFHQTIPFVYTAADYLDSSLKFSLLSYLIDRFQADTLYIANGSNWIYDVVSTLHKDYPGLRIVNQVYDHQFGWINRYNHAVATAIDAHISANPNITQAYIEHGVRPEQINFVEHAVNMDDLNPANYSTERRIQIKQKLGLPAEKKLVTFCARMHPQKRPLDFIELVRRFAGKEDLHFLMVGDGPLTPAVEEQIMRIGAKNLTRCKFYTPISDIYAITDVMVLPSEYEAMPLVILETLAMGKPVVATDVGHIRDVVETTHGGVVVSNIGDVASLRIGVLQALREPVDPAAMRQIIEQRFGISHIAQQYLNVLLGKEHA